MTISIKKLSCKIFFTKILKKLTISQKLHDSDTKNKSSSENV